MNSVLNDHLIAAMSGKTAEHRTLILASRSPRRRELIQLIAGDRRIEILPPDDSSEAGFDDCDQLDAIRQRLREIARSKYENVRVQLSRQSIGGSDSVIVAADTVIVAGDVGTGWQVLGQPPESEQWRIVVRDWFTRLLAGRDHLAITAVVVADMTGRILERTTATTVTFHEDVSRWLDWYIESGEPIGKAGGYAIQEAGSLFVRKVHGSLSNVVGLPLETLLEMLQEFDHGSS